MSQESNNKSGAWLLVLIMLSPLAYLLSIGPAVAIHPHLPGSGQDLLEAFYKPVEYLARIEPVERLLEIYLELWS